MKKVLLTLVLLAIGMTAFAQFGPGRRGGGRDFRPRNDFRPSPGRSFGGGFGGGYGYLDEGSFEFGMTLNHFTGRKEVDRPDRVGFFGEYRVYLGANIDVGAQISTTFGQGDVIKAVPHTVTVPAPNSTAENPQTVETTEYRNEKVGSFFIQVAPLVVTDINLMPYSGFNPYVGIGIGPGFGYERDKGDRHGTWTQALVISPRAGIELFERLRMFVQYQGYLSGGSTYSHVSFGLGWCFPEMMGMGPRRR
ncbi:MAG: hypothetical protein IKG84_02060 [Bacteroidales bacterium]|nr:hypothetical protein [Bacteroidales bacterium]